MNKPLKVSYAHMGTSTIAFEYLMTQLGHEVIPPPQPSERTLSLGTKHAPEFACIPFKIVLGTYLEVLERGANTLISSGGLGPCRAGYYGVIHGKILEQLGYSPEIVFFWPPLKVPLDFIRKVGRLKCNNTWRQTLGIIKRTLSLVDALDAVEKLYHRTSARELVRGSALRAFRTGLDWLRSARTAGQIVSAEDAALATLSAVPIDPDRHPLRVGIIGEIYVQLEPFANFFVEQFLGDLGVEAHRSIFLSHFTRHEIFRTDDESVRDLAAPYLSQKVGGHGQNSIADVVRYARRGFDGVIQLAPFTCIPEIVAKSILPHLSRKFNIPVLTLFIDEQTGVAGAQTRLEAFVDLMRYRRSVRPGLAHN